MSASPRAHAPGPAGTPARPARFASFAEFYPWYLGEHRHPTCRRLHVLGTTLVVLVLGWVAWHAAWLGLLALPVAGYGPAWAGHALFERNRPATFSHPLYSLLGDFRMTADLLTGRLPW